MKHVLGENSNTLLTNVQEGDSQPNACDLRLDKVFKINNDVFELGESHKQMRTTTPIETDSDGYFNLDVGSYEVVMENKIAVGSGDAGFVITRSTLNRNGVFLTSGLYDSGYGIDAKTGEVHYGVMAGVMHVSVGGVRLQRGVRVGQYLSFNAETAHLYDGAYGFHKQHDTKYK